MNITRQFKDGLTSLFNNIVNRRNAVNNNRFSSEKIDADQLRQIYKTGLGNKVARIKSGYAMDSNALVFESEEDRRYFERKLAKSVKRAALWMVAFGRGIIVIHEKGADLSKPLPADFDLNTMKLDVFSGDMVTVAQVERDLADPKYYQPLFYNVRGYSFHHSRVIDFSYLPVPELDAPEYHYGGMSEYQLIHNQMVNDAIVERACPQIVEKNSNLFYKIKDLKSLIQSKKEDDLLAYFTLLEDQRSIHGAGILDQEDQVDVVNQQMTNLSEVDQITLRRLAMVTGIPLAVLVGENVKGLNSTGDNEMSVFWSMIGAVRDLYLDDPLNELMAKLGKGDVWFNENANQTPEQRIEFEAKALANAKIMYEIGEDYGRYLEEKAIIKPNNFDQMFGDPDA